LDGNFERHGRSVTRVTGCRRANARDRNFEFPEQPDIKRRRPHRTGGCTALGADDTGGDIAPSGTITIPVDGNIFVVTGTTSITTINDTFPGRTVFLRFDDAVEIKTSRGLLTPTRSDESTLGGDVLCVINISSGVWEIVSWPKLQARMASPFRSLQVYDTA